MGRSVFFKGACCWREEEEEENPSLLLKNLSDFDSVGRSLVAEVWVYFGCSSVPLILFRPPRDNTHILVTMLLYDFFQKRKAETLIRILASFENQKWHWFRSFQITRILLEVQISNLLLINFQGCPLEPKRERKNGKIPPSPFPNWRSRFPPSDGRHARVWENSKGPSREIFIIRHSECSRIRSMCSSSSLRLQSKVAAGLFGVATHEAALW